MKDKLGYLMKARESYARNGLCLMCTTWEELDEEGKVRVFIGWNNEQIKMQIAG